MNPCETMCVAQGLYENGSITYTRTDSAVLPGQAMAAARPQMAELYGVEHAPERPRVYASKFKGVQEIHEAVRPAGDHFHILVQVSGELTGAQFRLCELVWERTVASQMADTASSTATVTAKVPLMPVTGESRDSDPTFSTAGPTAPGMTITFRGFLAAHEEECDAGRYQGDAGATTKDSKDARLSAMIAGQEPAALNVETSGHETTLPSRHIEASLVKVLEKREINRPSTYVATMSTIFDHGYVDHRDQALVPTWLTFAVTRLLEGNPAKLVDYDFTASMGRDLDRIATDEEDRVAWLWRLYSGQGRAGTEQTVQTVSNELEVVVVTLCAQGLKGLVDNLGETDARAVDSVEIDEGITLRVGCYGPCLENAEGKRANVPAGLAPDKLIMDKTRELFIRAADDGCKLSVDPVSGYVIIVKDGRYSPYIIEVPPGLEKIAEAETVKAAKTARPMKTKKTTKAAKAVKPRIASLLRSMDLSTVTLEQVLGLLSLPRVVSQDSELGEDIITQDGRYGPHLKKDTDSRSLGTGEQIFTATLKQALEIFTRSKRRREQATARGPLHELGQDLATEKPVVIKDGRFGPCTTDGRTNVIVPRSEDPVTINAEHALELLADKRAKGPAKKHTIRKTTSKEATMKKTTTKKATTIKKTIAQTTVSKTVASKEG